MSYNPFSLKGKTILITGASSGIGQKIAVECSNLDASLIITGRNEERLKNTMTLLKRSNHSYFVADLNKNDHLNMLVDHVPKIQGLILSAGIVKTLPFNFISVEGLNAVLDTNFISPVMLTQALMKSKKIDNGGSIVIISSISGLVCALAGNGIYSASKGAITAISKIMALEFSDKKIRVNCILSGMVRTNMTENLAFSDEEIDEDMKRYPLGYGEPADVAFGAVYLLSDASRWITGTDLKMDGGYTLR